MRVLRWRLKISAPILPRVIFLLVGAWLSIAVFQQIIFLVEEDIVYKWVPWDDSLDTKKFRLPSKPLVNYATVKDDNEFPDWTPSHLQSMLESPTTVCRRMMSLGGSISCSNCHTCKIDGNKYVCFDDDVRPIPGDCLIYSFGVGGEISWDLAMLRFNCSVYAFDMTMDWKNRALSRDFHFLNLGLFYNNYDSKLNMSDGAETNPKFTQVEAPFRTLATIRDILGHKDRSIDILKMDIEYTEWDVFTQILNSTENRKALNDVKQIALEVHLDDFKNASAAARVAGGRRIEGILEDLRQYGFQLAHTELNTAFQTHAEVRGQVVPLFRESLLIYRP